MCRKRVEGLDIFRGLALLLMMCYHFTYDLNHFNYIDVNMNHSLPFLLSRYTIMTMFLLSVGISLALVHSQQIRWKSIQKRMLLLGGASIIVSIGTFVVFPHSWVYFGILHFILVASLVGLLFLNYPKTSLATALLILIASATNTLTMQPLFQYLQPLLQLPHYTEDLVPFIPWFAVVLLGMVLVAYQLHKKIFTHALFSTNSRLNRGLKLMGRHSLFIYLIHQPIFFGGFMLFSTL